MEFFNSAVNTLQTIVIGLGGGMYGIGAGVSLLVGVFYARPRAALRGKMLMYGKVSQENYVEFTAASAIPNKEIKSPQILRY